MGTGISIIVPVYNAEAFLERCLDSLKAQSFGNWEAVCIDDGSTDSSPGILDAYAATDSRFKVIHKENAGVSAARNDGIQSASGRYVTFVDSDDFLHPQALEICMSVANTEDPDIIAYTYNRRYRRNTLIRHLFGLQDTKPHFRHYPMEAIDYRITDDILSFATEYSHPKLPKEERKWMVKHCQPWRVMCRRETIADIKFIPGIIYEDFPWWGEVMLKSHKAAILNLPLYFYYPNRGSYILSSRQHYRIDSLRIAIEAASALYREADPARRKLWEDNFMTPFRKKLESKIRKYGKDDS